MAEYLGAILSNDIMPLEKNNPPCEVKTIKMIHLVLDRESNTYPVEIMPIFPELFVNGATREKNTFEAIITFGDNQLPPRRSPLETSWTRKRT